MVLFSGQFKADEWHGFGTVTFPKGGIYQGVFENGNLKEDEQHCNMLLF